MIREYPHNPPSALSQAVTPIARVWLRVQNGVAKVFGFKLKSSLGGVRRAGLGTLIVAGAFSLIAPAGAAITPAGVLGVLENNIIKTFAESNNKR